MGIMKGFSSEITRNAVVPFTGSVIISARLQGFSLRRQTRMIELWVQIKIIVLYVGTIYPSVAVFPRETKLFSIDTRIGLLMHSFLRHSVPTQIK